MKVFFFLHEKPLITETFIVNDFEILEKSNIDFQVAYLNKKSLVDRQKAFIKYSDKFFYLRRLPKKLIHKIDYIVYHHFKFFMINPFRYFELLLWICFHFNKTILRDFLKIAKIIPLINNFKPDLFITRYPESPLVYCFLASKFYSKKYGLSFYSIYPNYSYAKHINNTISFIIVVSKIIKEQYLQKYPQLEKEKVKILPWGIDTDFFKRKEINKNKIFAIIVISQLIEKKGIIYLLKACRILKNKKYKFKCSVYGDGPEKEKLIKFIKMEKLEDSIDIKPAINAKNKLKKTYLSANLFVLPSIIDEKGQVDVIPNVLLEAMALEIPIITTEVNGMKEVILDGENGFLVKEKDEITLANLIIKIMKLSKEKRNQIGQKARKTIISNFNKDKYEKRLVNFLKRLC